MPDLSLPPSPPFPPSLSLSLSLSLERPEKEAPSRMRHLLLHFRERRARLRTLRVKAGEEISIDSKSISSAFSMLTLCKRLPAVERRKLIDRRSASYCTKGGFYFAEQIDSFVRDGYDKIILIM